MKKRKEILLLGTAAFVCNPGYSRDGDWEDCSLLERAKS
jgi:hypothetical protein